MSDGISSSQQSPVPNANALLLKLLVFKLLEESSLIMPA